MMIKKIQLFPIATVILGLGALTISAINKSSLEELKKEIEGAKEDTKSILRYQEHKNNQIDRDLEEIREEISSCYEHFETFNSYEER